MSRGKWVIGGLIVVMLAAAGVGVWLWRSGGSETAIPLLEQIPGFRQLPGAQQGQPRLEEEGQTASPEPTAGGTNTSLPEATPSLAVRLTYRTTPSFHVSVTRVARTFEVPTIARHAPQAGEPYSVLKIFDQMGRVIGEHRLTVQAHFHGEIFPIEDSLHTDLPEEELDVVVAVTAVPARVVVETASGTPLSEQTFTYEELPVDTVERQEPITGWLKVLAWLRRQTASARAQGGGQPFVVAVTDHLSPNGRLAALRATQLMAKEIEPWGTFDAQGVLQVVEVPGGDLGCELIPVAGGRMLPGCPNSGKVYRWVHEHGVRFNAIVVAMNAPCRLCGAAIIGSQIGTVSAGASREVIAHELGHAVRYARLQDEYLDKFKVEGPARGPNCFEDQPACEEAIVGFEGASCHVGCNSVSSFRPFEDGIMRSGRVPYGPLQDCLMSRAMAEEIGVAEPGVCGGTPEESDLPDYWGWRRGG